MLDERISTARRACNRDPTSFAGRETLRWLLCINGEELEGEFDYNGHLPGFDWLQRFMADMTPYDQTLIIGGAGHGRLLAAPVPIGTIYYTVPVTTPVRPEYGPVGSWADRADTYIKVRASLGGLFGSARVTYWTLEGRPGSSSAGELFQYLIEDKCERLSGMGLDRHWAESAYIDKFPIALTNDFDRNFLVHMEQLRDAYAARAERGKE